MTLHRIVLAFALSGASFYGCGSDTTTNDSPVTISPPDAGGNGKLDAATTPPASDAARPDAALAADSGARPSDGGTADSGARDSGTATDSGRAQDSGPGAVDSGAPSTVDSGMPMSAMGDPSSAACLKCETTECNMKKWPNSSYTLKDCSEFGTETAVDGMGKGKLRRTLCEEAVACMRETRCADPVVQKVDADGAPENPDATNCLCGMPYGACLVAKSISDLKGACRDKLADAAETNDLQTIHERLNDPGFPLGAADLRVMCSQNLCADECYAPCANNADGVSCAGALIILPDGSKPKPGAEGTCSMKSCVDYSTARYTQ